MNNLRPIHRAYIAGVFDGEGCITFRKDSHGRPRISIGQKDPEVLLWIQETLGFGHVRSYQPSQSSNLQWRFDLANGDDCLRFIEVVYKYSIVKRAKLAKAKRWLERRT
jgi:hypothetical protein